jgi:asparagine N-glycosylation enzyme membrane subunit Stt3
MKVALIAIVVFQIVTLFGVHKTLRSASRDRRWLVTHIGVPLMLDVILVLILLLVVPSFMHTLQNFLRYFAPDIFWLRIPEQGGQ